VTIVDDSYNALAGLGQAALDCWRPARPAVAVLGEMLELGDGHIAGHLDVGEAAAERRRPAGRRR
jgi:UDP-N-acetylmuramyl pentapeptide synthase